MDHRRELTECTQAFENTSTNVAAAQMRNSLTNLAETVEDPQQKKVRAIPSVTRHACGMLQLLTKLPLKAVRDRDGQLLRPLPSLPQRQGQGKRCVSLLLVGKTRCHNIYSCSPQRLGSHCPARPWPGRRLRGPRQLRIRQLPQQACCSEAQRRSGNLHGLRRPQVRHRSP